MNRFIHQLAETHGISSSSELNIDTLLSNSNTSTLELLPEHLEGQTLESIRTAIHTSLLTVYQNTIIDLDAIHTKLADYRYIDELYQLQRGKHVRWIRIPRNTNVINTPENTTPTLTNGGIVVDIKIQDTGVHVLCKNGKRYIQYKFDDCLTYQKLSTDELLILTAVGFTPTSV
jgi:hypothetical protein